MNTLDDLRSSLSRHADEIPLALPDRTDRHASLRGRIRRARNARRAGAAGALAAVVLVAGGVLTAVIPGRHGSPPVIAGHALPETVEVYGFGYRLDSATQSHPGARTLVVKLPRVDRDRVVSLVGTGLGSGWATLTTDPSSQDGQAGQQDRIVGGSAVNLPVPVADQATTLYVKVTGAPRTAQVGLAVYDADGSMPAGVSAHGLVLRRAVGSARLVAGRIGDAGTSKLRFRVKGPLRHMHLSDSCYTDARGAWMWVSIDGDGSMEQQCESPADKVIDVGAGESGSPAHGLGAGWHTITARVMRGSGKAAPPLDPADAQLAVGVYRDGPSTTVDGMAIPDEREAMGRLWKLVSVTPYRPGMRIDATHGPVQLGIVTVAHSSVALDVTEPDGMTTEVGGFTNGTGSAAASWGTGVLAGTVYRLHAVNGNERTLSAKDARTTILEYRPVR